MHMLLAIFGALFAILIIILIHEMGHLFVARLFGVKILRFSIGFGKAIWKHVSKKSGTEYVIALLPLGGYVKMLGEGDKDVDPSDAHRAFNKQPLGVRMLVVAAGPFVNFLLAILAFWGVFLFGTVHLHPVVGQAPLHSIAANAGLRSGDQIMKIDNMATPNWQRVMMALIIRTGDTGKMRVVVKEKNADKPRTLYFNLNDWKVDERNPDFLDSLGILPYQPSMPAVIGTVLSGSPAAYSDLKVGDKILKINGKKMLDWIAVIKEVEQYPDHTILIEVLRAGKRQTITVKTAARDLDGKREGYLGVMVVPPKWPPQLITATTYNVFTAWLPALEQTVVLLKFKAIILYKLITGKLSLHTLSGPITIFKAAGQASVAGFSVYLGFIGFISLTVGFINLLPIPALDGGHLLFQLIEWLIRRPIPERYQMIGLSLGVVFLVFLMVHATLNDIMRLL